jgi:putative nucleotidyltransferase with HDIG domain
MASLDDFIDKVQSLPPAPRILPELLTLLGHDDPDTHRVVELITYDPALTTKVIKLCNSAFFRGAEAVQDVQGAVTRLGFNQIYQAVASAVGEGTFAEAQKGYGIARGELWRHCAVTAIAGKVIARKMDMDENLGFTAALLHDIGKLALNTSIEGAYDRVVQETEEVGHSFLEAEKAILGVDHAEVGGRLLERWSFPEPLVSAVRHHHDPLQAGPHARLAACTHLADMVAHFLGHSYGHHSYAVRAKSEALDLLRLQEVDIEKLILATDNALIEVALLNSN